MLDDAQRQQIVNTLLQLAQSPQSITIDGTTIQYRSIEELLNLLRETTTFPGIVVKLRAPGAQN